MTTLLCISDTHIGSTVAVRKPEFELDDGDTTFASPGQRWLWDRLLEVANKAKKYKPILVLNGDIAEGDFKNRSYQMITRNKATIKSLAVDTLDPLCKIAKKIYVVRGTPAHVGKSAHLEEEIAKDFGAEGPSEKVYSHWYLPLMIDNIQVDIAHHTTAGGKPFSAASAANRTADRVMQEYLREREPLPHLVLRSHVHLWSDSYDLFPIRAIHLPAFTFATEFVNRIAPGTIADIGAVMVHISGNKYEVEKIQFKPEGRKWVRP